MIQFLRSDYAKGAVTGFATAFTACLFTSPVDGKTSRQKVNTSFQLLRNVPAKLAAGVRGRREKLHEFGKGRSLFFSGEFSAIKREAEASALEEYKRQQN